MKEKVAIFFQTIMTVCMYVTCSCIAIHVKRDALYRIKFDSV